MMRIHEGVFTLRPPLLNGSNTIFWKVRTKYYLKSLGANVWGVLKVGYQYPTTVPIDSIGNKRYETNAKDINALL